MMKILITGSNGLIGQKIFQQAREDKDLSVILTSRSRPLFDFGDCPFEHFDVTDFERAKALVKKYRPDAVIHTAALSQVDYCEQNPAESDTVNFQSVKNLALSLSESTDFILYSSPPISSSPATGGITARRISHCPRAFTDIINSMPKSAF